MKRSLVPPASILVFAVIVGCNDKQAPEAGGDAHQEHAEHVDEGHGEDEHQNEVHLSAEALELAGIHVSTVERRALSGGVGIPGEVQFEPSSWAHVTPLVPGRITRVSAKLGDAVRRGDALGIVASSDVSTARARLGEARARLAAAEATLRRQQELSAEGIGAQRSLIDAEAQVGQLQAEVEGATSSLPVPLSPRIRTVLSVGATLWIRRNTCCMARLWPTRFSTS